MGYLSRSTGSCLLALTVVGIAGCDRLAATAQAVSILAQSPNLRETVGDDYLATALPLDKLGGDRVTTALGWLGSRNSITSTEPPEPLSGALVSIKWEQTSVPMCESLGEGTPGTYLATDVSLGGGPTAQGVRATSGGCQDPRLQYLAGTLYKTEFETSTDLFVVQVRAPEAVNRDDVLIQPPLTPSEEAAAVGISLLTHPAGSELLLDWAAYGGGKHVFVTVHRIEFTGDFPIGLTDRASWHTPDDGLPLYDNLPDDAYDVLNLITDSPSSHLELPGSILSSAGLYLVVLTATSVSYDASNNLSVGSAATAGSGIGFTFFVAGP